MSFADSRLIRSMVSNCGNLAHEVTPQMNSASIGASKVASGEFGPAQPYDGQEGVMPKIAPRSENFMYLMYLVSMAITLTAVFLLAHSSDQLLRARVAFASDLAGFRQQVSPSSQSNATEPSVAVDRSDGTVYVAWQASGSHVARSDDGGRTFLQTAFPSGDVGDVAIRVGGPTPCTAATSNCSPGTHRVYVSSIELTPLALQTRLAFSDDRGAHWTVNSLAAFNPSFIDRPWLAVYASKLSANQDQVYIAYHDFSASQINVAASNDGGQTFGPSVDVLAQNGPAEVVSLCNTVPSGIEVDPETGDVYVQWITADPVANATQGCNLTQIQNFHQAWVAHSAPAVGTGLATLTSWVSDAHLVWDSGMGTNMDDIFATLAVDDS